MRGNIPPVCLFSFARVCCLCTKKNIVIPTVEKAMYDAFAFIRFVCIYFFIIFIIFCFSFICSTYLHIRAMCVLLLMPMMMMIMTMMKWKACAVHKQRVSLAEQTNSAKLICDFCFMYFSFVLQINIWFFFLKVQSVCVCLNVFLRI